MARPYPNKTLREEQDDADESEPAWQQNQDPRGLQCRLNVA
jgi:hypothetical protein